MERIHIFTDSSSDIPRAQVKEYGIEIVPLSVTHQGRTFREYYDITAQEYWKLLKDSDEIPVTAMATPAQFLDCYRRAYARGCTHTLGILINGKGSGTYQSAYLAREMFREEHGKAMQIVLLDSETYTYIYGSVVVRAAQMREQGDNFDAIVSVARSRLARMDCYLGVYTLRHLKKSGRISGGAAFVGETLGLKPISRVYNGAVTVCGKVRGEKALLNGVLQKVKEGVRQPGRQTAILLYGDIPAARVDELEKRLLDEVGFARVTRCPIGVSVITNTGPEAFAVAFYGDPRKTMK